MLGENFKVFFNAVSTDYGCHLFAVGWTTSLGPQPILEPKGENGDFTFYVKETGNPTLDVITPFQLNAELNDPPRSIHVAVENKDVQVQIIGLQEASPGGNTPGDWVSI